MSYVFVSATKALLAAQVLGFFDLDNSSTSPHTCAFLRASQQNGAVHDLGGELPRSFVLCANGDLWLTAQTVKKITSPHSP